VYTTNAGHAKFYIITEHRQYVRLGMNSRTINS